MGMFLCLLSVSVGFCASGILFCILNLFGLNIPTTVAAVLMAASSALSFKIMLQRAKNKYRICMRLWLEKGDFVFETYAKSEIDRTNDSVYASKLAINLCNHYTEKGDVENAKKMLETANPCRSNKEFNSFFFMENKFKMLYYNNIIFVNLLNNDIVSASVNYSDGKKYIDMYIDTSEYSCGLLHTRSMLELAQGETVAAMKTLELAFEKCKDEESRKELVKLKGKILSKII